MYPREGLPFLLNEGMEVTFVPPVLRVPRKGKVVSVSEQPGEGYFVYFDSIDSIDLAEQLQDHYCLVLKDDLPEDFEHLLVSFEGFKIYLADAGLLGEVVAVQENPAHPLLLVKTANEFSAEEKEIQIPLVEEFIVSLDEEQGVLTMELPEGLLNL